MDASLLWSALALVAGAALATAVCRLRFARALDRMNKKLEHAEQVRHTERERGQQMRAQITQLTKLVAELQQRQRRGHSTGGQRAELDKLVPDESPQGAAPLPSNGFADTMPM